MASVIARSADGMIWIEPVAWLFPVFGSVIVGSEVTVALARIVPTACGRTRMVRVRTRLLAMAPIGTEMELPTTVAGPRSVLAERIDPIRGEKSVPRSTSRLTIEVGAGPRFTT